MPTVIDSLIVTLGLDTSKFSSQTKTAEKDIDRLKKAAEEAADAFEAMKRSGEANDAELKKAQMRAKEAGDAYQKAKKEFDAQQKSQKEAALQAKKLGEAFDKVRGQLIGLFAVLTAGAGIRAFVDSITSADAALGRSAKNIGISADQLAAWQGAANQAGGSAEGITGTMMGLSQQFQQLALTGQSSIVPYFRAVGVGIADASGRMRPMGDILLDLADKFSQMDPARAQAIGRGMGIDEGTINVLMQGRSAVIALLAEQERLGHANKADTEDAIQRQAAWRKLIQTSEDLGRKLLTDLTPAILKMLDALTKFAEWAHKHPKLVEAAFAAITVAVTALSTAITINLGGALLGSASGFGIAALGAVKFSGALTLLLGKLGLVIGTVALVNEAINALDPNDRLGTWIDRNIPGAAAVDNFASKFGLGRSYAEQQQAEKNAGLAKKLPKEAPATTGSNQTEKDIAAFVAMGWSREQAAGIVANIQRESGGNEYAIGDKGAAYGLAQWHRDRQRAFQKWAGLDIHEATREQQLAFINYELREGAEKKAGAALAGTTDAGKAADIVSRQYERPAATDAEAAQRAALAAKLLAQTPIDTGIASGAAATAAASVNNSSTDNSSNRSVTVHNNIAGITVHTQATDGDGVADALQRSLQQTSFTSQANTGLAG